MCVCLYVGRDVFVCVSGYICMEIVSVCVGECMFANVCACMVFVLCVYVSLTGVCIVIVCVFACVYLCL